MDRDMSPHAAGSSVVQQYEEVLRALEPISTESGVKLDFSGSRRKEEKQAWKEAKSALITSQALQVRTNPPNEASPSLTPRTS